MDKQKDVFKKKYKGNRDHIRRVDTHPVDVSEKKREKKQRETCFCFLYLPWQVQKILSLAPFNTNNNGYSLPNRLNLPSLLAAGPCRHKTFNSHRPHATSTCSLVVDGKREREGRESTRAIHMCPILEVFLSLPLLVVVWQFSNYLIGRFWQRWKNSLNLFSWAYCPQYPWIE